MAKFPIGRNKSCEDIRKILEIIIICATKISPELLVKQKQIAFHICTDYYTIHMQWLDIWFIYGYIGLYEVRNFNFTYLEEACASITSINSIVFPRAMIITDFAGYVHQNTA